MRAYLWGTLIVTGLVMISAAVFSNVPGHVEIRWHGSEYRTPLLTGLFLFVAIVFFSYLLLRVLIGLFSLPGALGNLWRAKRVDSHAEHMSTGLAAFISEDWPLAHRSLSQGARSQGRHAPMFILLAAQAAMAQGDADVLAHYLLQAKDMELDKESQQTLAYLRAIAPGKAAHATPEQRATRLTDFLEEYPRHHGARHHLALVYQESGQTEQLEQLFDQAPRDGNASDVAWQQQIWMHRLDQAATADQAMRLQSLQHSWDKAPGRIKDSIDCIAHYLELTGLQTNQSGAEMAAREIEAQLKKMWHPQLVRLYGLVAGERVEAQIEAASAWLEQHQDDPDLALCLGRLYLRQGVLSKATEQLQRAAQLRAMDADILAELSRVAAAQGEFANSHQLLAEAKSSATKG